MISAKLHCTDYGSKQPCGSAPVSLEFDGDAKAVSLLYTLTHQIKFERHKLNQAQIACLKQQRRNINLKLEQLRNQSTKLESPTELLLRRAIISRVDQNKPQTEDLIRQRKEIDQQIYELTSRRIYNSNKLKLRYEMLLQELGFCLKSTQGAAMSSSVETYEYGGSNELIISRARAKIKELNAALNEVVRDVELTCKK